MELHKVFYLRYGEGNQVVIRQTRLVTTNRQEAIDFAKELADELKLKFNSNFAQADDDDSYSWMTAYPGDEDEYVLYQKVSS